MCWTTIKITAKRSRFPEVAIAFSDITSLSEELKWLIVKSTFPPRKISISRDVNGYELICAELAKHHPLSPRVKLLPMGVLLKGALPLSASIVAWAGILGSRDLRIVIPAGAVAVSVLGLSSYRLWLPLRRVRMRWVAPISLGSAWLLAAILIYRAVRRS